MKAEDFIKQATAVKDVIAVEPEMVDGSIYCLVVRDIWDFSAFKKLPSVIEFQGDFYNKTGYNSDTGKACYKITGNFAKVVES